MDDRRSDHHFSTIILGCSHDPMENAILISSHERLGLFRLSYKIRKLVWNIFISLLYIFPYVAPNMKHNNVDLKLTIPEAFYTWINISAVCMNHLDLYIMCHIETNIQSWLSIHIIKNVCGCKVLILCFYLYKQKHQYCSNNPKSDVGNCSIQLCRW